MKHKFVSILLVSIMLLASISSVFAQGTSEDAVTGIVPEGAIPKEVYGDDKAGIDTGSMEIRDDVSIDEDGYIRTMKGILIGSVGEDTPAYVSGILRGDILLSIDAKPVDTIDELLEVLTEYEHGQLVQLAIVRGGKLLKVPLTLESRIGAPLIGITGADGTGQMRKNFDGSGMEFFDRMPGFGFSNPDLENPDDDSEQVPELKKTLPGMNYPDEVITALTNGDAAYISEVQADSPAEKAGLLKEMLVLAVDGNTLKQGDLASVIHSYSPGDAVIIKVYSDTDGMQELEVILGDKEGKALLGVSYYQVSSIMGLPGSFNPGMNMNPWQNGQKRPFNQEIPETKPM